METGAPFAFVWMERLIAVAVVLQTIEYFRIRSSFGRNGIWAWEIVRRDFADFPGPLRRLFDLLMGERGFLLLLGVRLICALAAPWVGGSALWAILLISTVLIASRWRGSFNGGSDYMTIIVLSAVFGGRVLDGPAHPRVISVCLGYVAFQVCLSFFIAGVAKLSQSEWRNGKALAGFLSSAYYDVPERMAALPIRGALLLIGSWAILGFECLFPLALIDSRGCAVAIGLALVFQLINTWVFGLNRFFWAWGAAYPALYWCALRGFGL